MEYTHFDQNGNAVMVDVSDKIETKRTAVARGSIRMSRECYEKITMDFDERSSKLSPMRHNWSCPQR